MSTTPLFVVYGVPGSGRREVLRALAETVPDLVEAGDLPAGPTLLLLPAREGPHALDAALAALPGAVRLDWELAGRELRAAEPLPAARGAAFLVLDGLADLADQFEALKTWLPRQGLGLAGTYAVVHCALELAQPRLAPWHDAAVHFADAVFLNRREGVPNKWISEFRERFERERLPAHFTYVKRGQIEQPHQYLYPDARRLSLAFEDLLWDPETPVVDLEVDALPFHGTLLKVEKTRAADPADAALEDETIFLEDADPDEAAAIVTERWTEEDDPIPEDPYFERHPDGRRVRPLPDLRPFLQLAAAESAGLTAGAKRYAGLPD